MGPSKGDSKSRFHAGFLHKSRPEIAYNSCSRQVYPITLDATLIIHEITRFFPSNSRFHALKYAESRPHAFPLGAPHIAMSTFYFEKLSPRSIIFLSDLFNLLGLRLFSESENKIWLFSYKPGRPSVASHTQGVQKEGTSGSNGG